MRLAATLARFLCCALAILLLSVQALAWPGTVISVHDGDSLRVRDTSGNNIAVRLYGLDAPEMKTDDWPEQPYARQARNLLRQLVPRGTGVEVRVDQDATSYGRTVATVLLEDGREVNSILLEEGAAWFSDRHCQKDFCYEWKLAADMARQEKRGLWARDDAAPPWAWKYRHR